MQLLLTRQQWEQGSLTSNSICGIAVLSVHRKTVTDSYLGQVLGAKHMLSAMASGSVVNRLGTDDGLTVDGKWKYIYYSTVICLNHGSYKSVAISTNKNKYVIICF